MPNPFYGAALVAGNWITENVHRAWFPRTTIAATIQLTSIWITGPAQFQSNARSIAQAYIDKGFNVDKFRDSSIWTTTDTVTFRLDRTDTPMIASALGLIHDRSPEAANREEVVRSMEFAVYDDDGTVLRTHQEVQLYGGKALDEDAIQDSVLKECSSAFDRPVNIVPVDLSQVRSDISHRIDLRTRRLVSSDNES